MSDSIPVFPFADSEQYKVLNFLYLIHADPRVFAALKNDPEGTLDKYGIVAGDGPLGTARSAFLAPGTNVSGELILTQNALDRIFAAIKQEITGTPIIW